MAMTVNTIRTVELRRQLQSLEDRMKGFSSHLDTCLQKNFLETKTEEAERCIREMRDCAEKISTASTKPNYPHNLIDIAFSTMHVLNNMRTNERTPQKDLRFIKSHLFRLAIELLRVDKGNKDNGKYKRQFIALRKLFRDPEFSVNRYVFQSGFVDLNLRCFLDPSKFARVFNEPYQWLLAKNSEGKNLLQVAADCREEGSDYYKASSKTGFDRLTELTRFAEEAAQLAEQQGACQAPGVKAALAEMVENHFPEKLPIQELLFHNIYAYLGPLGADVMTFKEMRTLLVSGSPLHPPGSSCASSQEARTVAPKQQTAARAQLTF